MASLSRTRASAIFALTVTVGTFACGHSALELMPEDADGGGIGSGDGGGDADVTAQDASVDAGCVGPSCPGTYVAVDVGDDTNPGTGAAPVKTIAKGMAIAAQLGGARDVFVAAGRYTEKVTLVEGINLVGGYACSAQPCTWARDPDKNDTAILDTDFEGVLAGKTISRKTRFEGFRVQGLPGTPLAAPGAAAMTVDGGTPTIARCRIIGGDTTGGPAGGRRSIGLLVLAPSNDPKGSLIVDNRIGGGSSSEGSIGLLFAYKTQGVAVAVATVKQNSIRGGPAASSIGLAAWSTDATTLVQNNIISGGAAPAAPGQGSWGVTIERGGLTLDRNRINVDPGAPAPTCVGPAAPEFCGGVLSLSSTSVVTNNVIRGVAGPRSCAVALYEAEQPAGTIVLNGNVLDAGGSGAADGSLSAAVALRTIFGTNALIGSVRNNILVGGTSKERIGVLEVSIPGKTARPVALDNNDFWYPPVTGSVPLAYRSWSGNAVTDVSFGNLVAQLAALAPVSNLSVDPMLDANFHLKPGSPVIDKGTATEAPATDIDGENRPKGAAIDIGADEAL